MHFPMLVQNHDLNAGQHSSRLRLPFVLICLITLVSIFLLPTAAQAATLSQNVPSGSSVSELACFAVADEHNDFPQSDANQPDTLTVLDPATGETQIVGPTNTRQIEAISFGPNNDIYAANGKRLGTLNKDTGAFTQRSRNFGIAEGSVGEIELDDVDGIAFDLVQNILFGAQRLPQPPLPPGGPPPDILFAIDPVTGRHIPNYFGSDVDYVVVPEVKDDEDNVMFDVDDIQFDPVSGELYGVLNNGGASGVLATIVITPGVSSVTVNPIGTFRDAGDDDIIDDIEGISFGNDGTLYVSTGDNFTGDPDDLNALYVVNPATAQATLVGHFPTGPKDYEALACLSAEAAIVLRKYTNGPGQSPDDADNPTGPVINVGDTVTWTYIFTNTGVLDLTDFVLVDDQLGLIDTSLTCVPPGDTLAPGFSKTCNVTGIATAGQYANVATVTANSVPTPLFPEPLPVSDTNPSHYFGLLPGVAALGDFVWHDENANGAQDAGEPGVPGVTVTLFSCSNDQPLDSIVTDEDGKYLFTDLPPECYYVVFSNVPDDFSFTTHNAGGVSDAKDSDADPTTGRTPSVTLNGGQQYLDLDAGLVEHSLDIVATPLCVQDAPYLQYSVTPVNFTPGANPVTIRWINVETDAVIYEFTNQPLNATVLWPEAGVDENGNGNQWPGWSFEDGQWVDNGSPLRPLVRVEISVNPEESFVVDYPPATPTCSTGPLAALGDTVWFDANRNGLQDGVGTEGGEAGVPNVQVNLVPVESATVSSVASTAATAVSLTTDENGLYLFEGLQPGDYYVQFIGPAEYGFTLPDAEANGHDDADSDAQVPLLALSVHDTLDEVQPGQHVTYTIYYTNTHDTLPASNATLSTTVPAGTTFVAAGSNTGWTCADVTPGSACSLSLANVVAGASGSVDFVVRLQELEDDETLPPAIFILVRLIQSKQANTQIVTLAAGDRNLTLDAGLVPIQNSGDVEADEQTPTTITPTGLPPNEQPQQQDSLYLPSLRDAE